MAAPDEPERRSAVVPALLLALLALPFDPGWIDFETARRGLLLVVAGALVATSGRWWPAALPGGALPFALFCAWYLVRSIGVTNVPEALLRAAHWIALFALFVFGATRGPRAVAVALVPVGILVAAYGTAQVLGLEWPAGYGRPTEPVSTLGNRNVASEVAVLGLVAAAGLAGRGSGPAAVAALVIGIYVGLNGTRAGLLGGLLGLTLVLVAPWRHSGRDGQVAPWRHGRRAALLASIAAVLVVAYWLRPTVAAAPPETTAQGAAADLPSTIDVRLALWEGSLAMVADAPLVGHGSGQFRYEYPRFRTQEEIERSTFGRRFPTVAESAHSDPLEIAADTGLVGLSLAVWLLVAAWRAAWPKLRAREPGAVASAAALIALAIPLLVRSPLGNAPAAAGAALLLGALASRDRARAPAASTRSLLGIVAGLSLAIPGAMVVGAASRAGDWLAGAPDEALEQAITLHPSEPRYRALRLQARSDGTSATDGIAREDLAELLRLDPNNTNALFLIAQFSHRAGESEMAKSILARLLTLDPREPRAQALAGEILVQEGDVARGIATLYANPHPRLRDRLGAFLAELVSASPGLDPSARHLLEREAAFVHALDAVLAEPAAAATSRAVLRFAAADPTEVRARALLARIRQATGAEAEAAALAPERVELAAGVRTLLAPLLDELSRLASWQRALAR